MTCNESKEEEGLQAEGGRCCTRTILFHTEKNKCSCKVYACTGRRVLCRVDYLKGDFTERARLYKIRCGLGSQPAASRQPAGMSAPPVPIAARALGFAASRSTPNDTNGSPWLNSV